MRCDRSVSENEHSFFNIEWVEYRESLGKIVSCNFSKDQWVLLIPILGQLEIDSIFDGKFLINKNTVVEIISYKQFEDFICLFLKLKNRFQK